MAENSLSTSSNVKEMEKGEEGWQDELIHCISLWMHCLTVLTTGTFELMARVEAKESGTTWNSWYVAGVVAPRDQRNFQAWRLGFLKSRFFTISCQHHYCSEFSDFRRVVDMACLLSFWFCLKGLSVSDDKQGIYLFFGSSITRCFHQKAKKKAVV